MPAGQLMHAAARSACGEVGLQLGGVSRIRSACTCAVSPPSRPPYTRASLEKASVGTTVCHARRTKGAALVSSTGRSSDHARLGSVKIHTSESVWPPTLTPPYSSSASARTSAVWKARASGHTRRS